SKTDLMICEGTRIDEATLQSENDVFEACKYYADQAHNSVIIADYSYKDVDRFTTFYRVAKSSNRVLLLNTKAARYLRALSESNARITLPKMDDENIGIYMPRKEGG